MLILVGIIIALLLALSLSVLIFIDVYEISKLSDNEADIDCVKFGKCILPYKA